MIMRTGKFESRIIVITCLLLAALLLIPVTAFSQPEVVVDPSEFAFDLPLGMNEGGVLNINNDGDSLLIVEASQGGYDQDLTISLVIWTRYADMNWSYQNVLISLAALPVGYRITEYAGSDPAELAELLNSAHVFLIPVQTDVNRDEMTDLGEAFSATLEEFIHDQSGIVICIDHEEAGSEFLRSSDLIDIRVLELSEHLSFETTAFHPVNAGVHQYSAPSACNLHSCNDVNSVTISRDTLEGEANITAKTIADGGVVYFGLSWQQYNREMTQLLVNAVSWSQGGSSWLILEDIHGRIEPHDSEDMFFRIDAGLVREAGSYTRELVLTSNDPVNPIMRIPVSLEVTHPLPSNVVITPARVFVTADAESDTSITLAVRNNGPGVFICDVVLDDVDQEWLSTNRTSMIIWPNFQPRLLLYFHPDSTVDDVNTNWVQFKIPNSDSVLFEIPVFYYIGDDFGTLDGYITDAVDDSPIQGATVDVHGLMTISDQNGRFEIEEIPPFNYIADISHPDYLKQTSEWIRIQQNRVTSVDFEMTYCQLEYDFVDLITERLRPDNKTVVEGYFANSGTGALDFKVRFIDLDPPEDIISWERRGVITAADSVEVDQVSGAVYTGEYLVLTGTLDREEHVYILNREGSPVNSFLQPAGHPYGISDMAYDGDLVYGTGINQLIGFNINGDVQNRINTPLNYNRAIAYDPGRDVFLTANSRSDIVVIDRQGDEINRISNPGVNLYGLSWWGDQPDGYCLIMFCRDGPNDSQINLMNLENGDIRIMREIQSDIGERAGGIAITSKWDYRHWSIITQLSGGSNRTTVYNLADLNPWVYTDPDSASIQPEGQLPLSIHFDASGFRDEDHAEGYFIIDGAQRGGSDTLGVAMLITENSVPSDKRDKSGLPGAPVLTAYPNPSNGYVKIDYQVQPYIKSVLGVYDITGRQVFDLVVPESSISHGSMLLNFENHSTGLYFIELESGSQKTIQRVLLMK